MDEKEVMLLKVLFFALICSFCLGCATEARYQVKKPFLYEVTKEDRKAYLFGTMHIGVALEDLPDSFWPYFNESDIVVTETDSDDRQVAFSHLVKRMLREGGDPKPTDLLTLEECEIIFKKLKKKFRLSQIDDLNRFSLYAIYVLLVADVADNYNEEVPVKRGEYVRLTAKTTLDQRLLDKATAEQNKIMDTLDSLNSDSFWDCFIGDSEKQVQNIRKIIRLASIRNSVAEILELAEQYRSGNEEALGQKLVTVPECVLKERNKSWISDMSSIMLHYKRPFFAVGVGHIVAKKDSLIDLLKERGYKVRRMTETFLPNEK